MSNQIPSNVRPIEGDGTPGIPQPLTTHMPGQVHSERDQTVQKVVDAPLGSVGTQQSQQGGASIASKEIQAKPLSPKEVDLKIYMDEIREGNQDFVDCYFPRYTKFNDEDINQLLKVTEDAGDNFNLNIVRLLLEKLFGSGKYVDKAIEVIAQQRNIGVVKYNTRLDVSEIKGNIIGIIQALKDAAQRVKEEKNVAIVNRLLTTGARDVDKELIKAVKEGNVEIASIIKALAIKRYIDSAFVEALSMGMSNKLGGITFQKDRVSERIENGKVVEIVNILLENASPECIGKAFLTIVEIENLLSQKETEKRALPPSQERDRELSNIQRARTINQKNLSTLLEFAKLQPHLFDNDIGKAFIEVAQTEGIKEIAKIFFDAGAGVNLDMNTALKKANKKGNREFLDALWASELEKPSVEES